MTTIYLFSGLLIALYVWMILWFIKGWNTITTNPGSNRGCTLVTVIIPFRNEESNIPSLLNALISQTYPKENWKALFIDDHSTDRSNYLIKNGFQDGELLSLPSGVAGKKSALEYGAKMAKSELLLFIDADCIPVNDWISSIVSCYERTKPVLISAPVIMNAGISFLSKFQALEFLSLSAAGAASFGNQDPIMANGANLAVKREIYIENLEKRLIKTPSGDDIFLLLSLKKRYPGKLVYLKSEDAIVRTSSMPDLKSFVQQRLRWTSKARHYKDRSIILISVLVFLINFLLLASFVFGLFIFRFTIIWVAVFFIKSIADYIFLRKAADFTGQKSLLRIFVLSQFVYFLYIGFTGIFGNLTSVKWKGRKF